MIRYVHAFLPMSRLSLPQVVSGSAIALSSALVEFSYFLPMMVIALFLTALASSIVPGCFD